MNSKIRTALFVLAMLALLATAGIAFAQADGPTELEPTFILVGEDGNESVYIFQWNGQTCVRVGDSLECFCECTSGCDTHPTVTLTPTPEGTPPPPNGTPTPPPPTVTPGPNPTPENENCNRGIGNLDEGCDPGNSSGQGQGDGRPAGEDRREDEGSPDN